MPKKEIEAAFTITIKGYVKGIQSFNPSDLDAILPSNYVWFEKGASYRMDKDSVAEAKRWADIKR